VGNQLAIEWTEELEKGEDLRVYPITQRELLIEGAERQDEGDMKLDESPDNLIYAGDKWGGKYLRAPEIFFTILEKGKGKLVRLGDIAEVRRGFTTGANEFFYLEVLDYRPVCPVCGVVHENALTKEEEREYLINNEPIPEGVLIAVRNGAGWEGYIEGEFLKPVVKSPREIKTIKIRPEDLRYRVFMCHMEKEAMARLGKRHALDYIKWGEGKGYQNRPTCKSRVRWWDVGIREISSFLCTMTYRERFFMALNGVCFADARMYDIYCPPKIGVYLNSTHLLLFLELSTRTYGGGGGPVDVKVYEVLKLPIPHVPDFLGSELKLSATFKVLASRPIKSIFEELGLPKPCTKREHPYCNINPDDVSLDKVMPDRRELDRIIFEALGLTKEEQLQVYKAVVELVKNRLVRARTV